MISIPQVSIIIPSYNCAKHLSEAIESVLAQTYTNYELIVVDDGSTDNTKEIVNNYIKKYPDKIRYFYQDNIGPGAARNKGMSEARGGCIAFLDADDIWDSEKLDIQINYLKENNNISAVFTNVRILKNKTITKDKLELYDTIDKQMIFKLMQRDKLLPSTLMIKKDCLKKTGGFDESFKQAEDADLWLRILHRYELAVISQPLVTRRVLIGSLSKTKFHDNVFYYLIKAYKKYLKSQPRPPYYFRALAKQSLSNYYFNMGWNSFHNGQIKKVFIFCIKSIFYNPLNFNAGLYLFYCLIPKHIYYSLRRFERLVEVKNLMFKKNSW